MCFWNSICESELLTASKWIVQYPSRLILVHFKRNNDVHMQRHAIAKQLNCNLKEYCDVLQVPVLIRNLPLKVWTVKDQSQLSCPIRPILIYLFGKMIKERTQLNMRALKKEPLLVLQTVLLKWHLQTVWAGRCRRRKLILCCMGVLSSLHLLPWAWISENWTNHRVQMSSCLKMRERSVTEYFSVLQNSAGVPALHGCSPRKRKQVFHP